LPFKNADIVSEDDLLIWKNGPKRAFAALVLILSTSIADDYGLARLLEVRERAFTAIVSMGCLMGDHVASRLNGPCSDLSFNASSSSENGHWYDDCLCSGNA